MTANILQSLLKDFALPRFPIRYLKRCWKSYWKIGLAVAVLSTVTVAVVAAKSFFCTGSEAAAHAAATQNERTRSVKALRVKAAGQEERTYTGVVKPRHETDLGFRVAGKVIAREVEVGDHVSAGHVIARLDPADYELAVRIAEADLAAAEAEASNAAKEESRYQRLADSNAASKSEIDRAIDARKIATARVDRAQRALRQAQNRLEYCTLTTDVYGVITSLPVETGQVVGEGTPIARVARTDELEAVVSIPENRADDAQATARLTVWGESGIEYPLMLRELSPSVDAATRTFQARFSIENPGHDIVIGRTVKVSLTPVSSEEAVVVPLTALMERSGQTSVWRIEGEQLVATPVTVIAYREDEVVVVGEIQPEDTIVAAGVQKIDAGLKVRVWEGN